MRGARQQERYHQDAGFFHLEPSVTEGRGPPLECLVLVGCLVWQGLILCLLQALHSVLSSWVSRRFFGGCAVLFPMVITVYITWWFLTFFDNFFSVRIW